MHRNACLSDPPDVYKIEKHDSKKKLETNIGLKKEKSKKKKAKNRERTRNHDRGEIDRQIDGYNRQTVQGYRTKEITLLS